MDWRQQLQTLHLGSTKKMTQQDLSMLVNFPNLRCLDLSRIYVVDVTTLANCVKLHTLLLGGTRVSDISALGKCSELQELRLKWPT